MQSENKEVSFNRFTAERDATNSVDESNSKSMDAQAIDVVFALEKKVKYLEEENAKLVLHNLSRNFDAEVQRAVQLAIEPYLAEQKKIKESTSWRITKPVRWLGRWTQNARGVVKLVSSIARRPGDMPAALQRLFDIWKELGWVGVRQAVSRISLGEAARGKLAAADYLEWLRRYDTLDAEGRSILRTRVMEMAERPKISILMPTYNSKIQWLKEAIESVKVQIYEDWELCIADDASTDAGLVDFLKQIALSDRRIKVVFRKQNGHISEASNSALAIASGPWVALMDHDDVLPEHALFWMADAIQNNPDAKLFYSDEDKIDENGIRKDPYFKSDWNIDLFYSHNMFSHFGLFEAKLVHAVGGFRRGMEGAQDYDLVLRCMERLAPGQIKHVSKVLYHWRVHVESTASSTGAKPYAQVAAQAALNEHFSRMKIRGSVENVGNGYRVRYDLPTPAPLVSLIIPTRNAEELVRQCINSILELTSYPNYEVIIVDNGSDDASALAYFSSLSSDSRIRVIRDDGDFNYSALNNRAARCARGEYVGLINNDIEVISKDWLSEMVSIASQPGVGAVGARLWYPDHTLQHGGVVLGIGGVAGHAHKRLPRGKSGYFERGILIQSYSAVTAACLVVRKDHYFEVDGLNEIELKVAFNDVDFCLRLLEKGLRNVWTPYAELFHHESATRGNDVQPEKQRRFQSEVRYMLARWNDVLRHDPAYNPNLTLEHEDFSLAWPPITR